MTDLDPAWRLYARLQLQSRHHARMDALGWGIEAALDHFLDLRANDNFSDQVATNEVIERGKARERYRTRLRAHYLDPSEVNDPTPMLDERARLREVLARVDREECG